MQGLPQLAESPCGGDGVAAVRHVDVHADAGGGRVSILTDGTAGAG